MEVVVVDVFCENPEVNNVLVSTQHRSFTSASVEESLRTFKVHMKNSFFHKTAMSVVLISVERMYLSDADVVTPLIAPGCPFRTGRTRCLS